MSLETSPLNAPGQALVSDFNLTIRAGETVGILGESGSGKSLTSLALLGLLPTGVKRTQGSVAFAGEPLTNLGERELQSFRGGKMALVLQDPTGALNPVIRVGKQVEEVLVLHRPDMDSSARKARIEEIFLELDLQDPGLIANRFPHELSGGQRQRVLLAIALAGDPELLIADEPTTALDSTVQAKILDLVKGIVEARQLSLLWISHDLGVLAYMCERILVLNEGRIIEEGPVAKIFGSPEQIETRELVRAFPRIDSLSEPPSGGGSLDSSVLTIENLEVSYPETRTFFGRVKTWREALSGIDLVLEAGKTLALVGESGAGKTSVVRAILGLTAARGAIRLRCASGEVVDLLSIKEKRLRPLRKEMGFVFQDPRTSLNPKKKIGWSIGEPFLIHEPLAAEIVRKRVSALLADVGLSVDDANRFPHEMSGGQLQRAAIARALALRPRLILLDESVSALDAVVQDKILDLLSNIQSRHDVAYLFITHDLRAARRLAHEVAVLQNGELVEHGTAERVFGEPVHPHTQELLNSVVEIGAAS